MSRILLATTPVQIEWRCEDCPHLHVAIAYYALAKMAQNRKRNLKIFENRSRLDERSTGAIGVMKYQKPTRSTRINAGGRPQISKYAAKQQRRRVAELAQQAEIESGEFLPDGNDATDPKDYLN